MVRLMYNPAYNYRVLATVKKWGNSLGLVVPADVAKAHGLKPGDTLEVEFRRRVRSMEELSGTMRFRRDLLTVLREMEAGWDDL